MAGVAETADGPRQYIVPGRRNGGDGDDLVAQMGEAPGVVAQREHRLRRIVDEGPGPLPEMLGGKRRRHRPCRALKQRRAQPRLQLLDPAGQRRLRYVQMVGCPLKRTEVGHREKCLKVGEIEINAHFAIIEN